MVTKTTWDVGYKAVAKVPQAELDRLQSRRFCTQDWHASDATKGVWNTSEDTNTGWALCTEKVWERVQGSVEPITDDIRRFSSSVFYHWSWSRIYYIWCHQYSCVINSKKTSRSFLFTPALIAFVAKLIGYWAQANPQHPILWSGLHVPMNSCLYVACLWRRLTRKCFILLKANCMHTLIGKVKVSDPLTQVAWNICIPMAYKWNTVAYMDCMLSSTWSLMRLVLLRTIYCHPICIKRYAHNSIQTTCIAVGYSMLGPWNITQFHGNPTYFMSTQVHVYCIDKLRYANQQTAQLV